MRLVVQRVLSASVRVVDEAKTIGKIEKGLFVLVGVGKNDSKEQAEILAAKLAKLRVMADDKGKMNLPAKEFLAVSQFTLYADASKGNRPSFVKAEAPGKASEIYKHFVSCLEKDISEDSKIETGSFGNYMEIKADLDGPVTIILES